MLHEMLCMVITADQREKLHRPERHQDWGAGYIQSAVNAAHASNLRACAQPRWGGRQWKGPVKERLCNLGCGSAPSILISLAFC